jgi:hypothetical protein
MRHEFKTELVDSEMFQTNKNMGNMKDYYASPKNISQNYIKCKRKMCGW